MLYMVGCTCVDKFICQQFRHLLSDTSDYFILISIAWKLWPVRKRCGRVADPPRCGMGPGQIEKAGTPGDTIMTFKSRHRIISWLLGGSGAISSPFPPLGGPEG